MTDTCRGCGFANPEGTKFCGECGVRLGVVACPKCRSENPPNFKFCGECGEALAQPKTIRATPPHSTTAERRQITVLFSDLVDSTALAERLDPEDFRDVVRDYQATCGIVIDQYAGHVAQYLGDGLLVYFGYPQAHEDDARRAVHTGLGIVAAVRRLSDRLATSLGIELSCRIGIHTGEVVTGQMGAGDTTELLAMGQAPAVAGRVQGIAGPNTVLLTGAVDRLIRGYFDCESLGSRAIKGVSKPVELYRVIKHSGVRDSFEVAKNRGLTPVAGRQAELEALLAEVKGVVAGKGRAITLAGEGGIGKSRLVQILRERTAGQIPLWFVTRCSAYHQQSPLSPFIDLVLEQLGIKADVETPERLRRLEKSLENIGLPVAELAPPLAAFISIPVDGRYPPAGGTPQKRKEQVFEALLAVLLRLTEQGPVCLVTEDLHWADPSTLEFLELVLARGQDVPLMVILTHRPIFTVPWTDFPHLMTLPVSRLGPDNIVSMIGALTGGMALPPELLDQILDKTDGVPLYVEELTKMILETDLLRPGSMGYELTKPLPQLAIPATLQDSLTARLDLMGEARTMAQMGSVLGREFTYDVLHAVADMDAALADQFIGRLVSAGIFVQTGMPPDATYSFTHALVEDAAYSSLVKTTRQGYHRRAAETMAAHFPEQLETQPELVAHHYEQAGDGERAILYWTRAGRVSLDRFANLEAANHLHAALNLLQSAPPSPERYGREITVQTLLGSAIIAIQGYTSPGGRAAFARALELSEPMGDIPELFRALQGLWMFHVVRADYAQALQLAERLQRAAPQSDRALRMQGHYCMAFTQFFLGRFDAAQREFELGITLDAPDTDFATVSPTGDDIRVHLLCFMALNLWHLGFPDQAREQIYRAVDRARRAGHPFGISWALCIQGWLHQLRRESGDAFSCAQESLAIAHRNGFAYISGLSSFLVGLGMVQTAGATEGPQIDTGIARMQQSVQNMVGMGARLGETLMVSQLIESTISLGRIDIARAALAANRKDAPHLEEQAWEAEFHRQAGEIAQHDGQSEVAEQAYRDAIDIATRQNAMALRLRASIGLAQILIKQHRGQDARTILEDAAAAVTEGADTDDVRSARALVDQLV